MKIFYSDKNPNILYINNEYYQNMKNLKNYIKDFYLNSCESNVSFCFQNNCNSYLVAYFDEIPIVQYQEEEFEIEKMDTDIDNFEDEEFEIEKMDTDIDNYQDSLLKIIEEKYYQSISAFLTIEIYSDNINEINNICVKTSSRGKNVMKQIFDDVMNQFSKEIIYIGVRLDDPNIKSLSENYISYGFKPKEIVFYSPHKEFSKTPLLSLEYQKEKKISFENNINEAYKMVISFKNKIKKCNFNILLTKKLIEKINKNFIKRDREFAGILTQKNKKNNTYELKIDIVTKAEENNVFSVNTPTSLINWHTHPYICYTTFRCFIQWPSGQDMKVSINKYLRGQVVHFLFSLEGIYLIQIHPMFMIYILLSSPKIVENIGELVAYNFGNLEHFRDANYDKERLKCLKNPKNEDCYTYHTNTRHLSIQQIVDKMNTTTLKDILNLNVSDSLKDYQKSINFAFFNDTIHKINEIYLKKQFENLNFPLFDVKFMYYEDGKINEKIEFFIPSSYNCSYP